MCTSDNLSGDNADLSIERSIVIGHQERTAVDMVVWFLATAWASGIDRSVVIGHWAAGGEVFCGEVAGWIGYLAEKMMAVRFAAKLLDKRPAKNVISRRLVRNYLYGSIGAVLTIDLC